VVTQTRQCKESFPEVQEASTEGMVNKLSIPRQTSPMVVYQQSQMYVTEDELKRLCSVGSS